MPEDLVGSPVEQLVRLATRIGSNAAVSSRPGQTADLILRLCTHGSG